MTISSTNKAEQVGSVGASIARDEASNMASSLAKQSSAVADTARQDGQRIMSDAKEQLGNLTEQARRELHDLIQQSQEEFAQRADEQTDKAATALRSLAEEFGALADGRTTEAPHFVGMLREASQRARRYADRLDQGGIQGVGQELAGFARRRPGVFLLSAIAAGFVGGRLVRGVQQGGSAAGPRSDQGASVPLMPRLEGSTGNGIGNGVGTGAATGFATPEPSIDPLGGSTGTTGTPPEPGAL